MPEPLNLRSSGYDAKAGPSIIGGAQIHPLTCGVPIVRMASQTN